MKIAFVVPRFFPTIGGGETHAHELAAGLSEYGHNVSVITNKLPNRDLDQLPFRLYEIEGLDDRFPNAITAIPGLHSHFAQHNYQVVHVYNYLTYFLFTNAVKINPDIQYVFSTHNTPDLPRSIFSTFNDYSSELFLASKLLDYGPHTAVVVGSKIFKDSIEYLASRPQNVHLINLGTNLRRFYPAANDRLRAKYGVLDSEILILATSRFVYRKNLEQLLSALTFLPSSYKLLLTGSAEPQGLETFNGALAFIKDHKLQKRVILLKDVVPFDELPNYYRAANIFAITSEMEGFGIAIIEAMASGTPVIGTDVTGIRDLVKHNQTGMLVPLNDARALAQTIKKAVNDKALQNELVTNALRMVRSDFDNDKLLKQHEEVYLDLIKTKIARDRVKYQDVV